MATDQAKTGLKAIFKRNYTDPETNTPIPAGAELVIIDRRGTDRIQCSTGEIPIWVPLDAVEIK